MPNLNQSFGGSTLILSGAYYKDNVSNTLPANETPGFPLLFVGVGYGGIPNTPYHFSDANSLKTFMRGSASARFVDFLSNPSGEVPGAQQFVYINPAPNTPAIANLVSSGPATVVQLTAANYGTPGNAMTYQVAAGTIAGINLTLADPYTGTTLTGYNLGVPFQLSYSGSSSAVTYTVTTSGSAAISFSTAGGAAGENVSIDLTSPTYNTIAALVAALNGTGHYVANVISNGNLPSGSLDAVAASALASGASGGAFVNVTSTLPDVAYWVNNSAQAIATAATSGTSIPANAPVSGSVATFSGGTNVVPSNNNYASALNTGLTEQAFVLFIDSNVAAIQALGQAHVAAASTVSARSWRRYVTGSNLGDSVATAQAAARALNAINCTFAYPGIEAVDPTSGNTITYSGLYLAACYAGMMAGGAPALPLTNKAVNAVGMEVNLSIAQIDQLQQAGVMVTYISPETQVPTINRDFTTWQNDPNIENCSNQQVSERYILAYSIVQNLAPYIGQVASTVGQARIQNQVKRTLNALIYNDASGQGILNSWDPRTLVLTYDGTTQVLSITVDVVLVGSYTFITFTGVIDPLLL